MEYAIQYQTTTALDGLLLPAFGPMEGLRLKLALFSHSNIEDDLRSVGVVYVALGASRNTAWKKVVAIVGMQGVFFQGTHLLTAELTVNAYILITVCFG